MIDMKLCAINSAELFSPPMDNKLDYLYARNRFDRARGIAPCYHRGRINPQFNIAMQQTALKPEPTGTNQVI